MDKITSLRQMAAEDPSDPLVFFLLGSELLRAERFEESAHAFSCSLELQPNQAAAARLLGDAYRRAGNKTEAIAAYKLAIQLSERSGDLQAGKEARVFLKRLDSRR